MKKDIRFHFVAYLSPPPAKVGYGEFAENANFIDEENYRTMTECGFDRAIGLFENRTAHYLAGMRQAEKAGMEYFVRDQFKSGSLEGFIDHPFRRNPRISAALEAKIAKRFDHYADMPAFSGILASDEPPASKFPAIRAAQDWFFERYPGKKFIVNLLPTYANAEQLSGMKGAKEFNFEKEYVGAFIDTVRPEVLSYDHYALIYDAKNKKNVLREDYTQDTSKPIPNDDVDLQLVWLRAVELEKGRLDSHVLAEYWSTYISASLSEYGTGKNNFRMGIRPPLSGHLRNRNRDSNGAWIRTEIWACLAAGHPDVAVRYALEDAMVDHSGEGVYSAIFLAAMQSAAFVESDPYKLISIGLSYIPEDCGITKGVHTVMECKEKGMDWKQARKALFQAVPGSFGMMGGYYKGQIPEEDVPVGENGYDAPSNVGIIIIGLLYGEGDFGRSICLATNCGEDTDCTAGSLGALLGIISGKSNLPEKWVKGCSDEISTWCLRIDAALRLPKTVSEFAERIIRQTPVVLTDYCDFSAKNGFMLETADKLERCDDVWAPYWNTFKGLLSEIPNATRDRFVLYDVVIEYDEDFVSLTEGKEKVLNMRFINKLFDPQYLTVRILDFPEEFIAPGGTEKCVGIEHLHGSFNESRLQFRFTPQLLKKGRYDMVLEIKSEGRMTKNYIPLTFINGNCVEVAK